MIDHSPAEIYDLVRQSIIDEFIYDRIASQNWEMKLR